MARQRFLEVESAVVRGLRLQRKTMAEICAYMQDFTREQIVELIDGQYRFTNDFDVVNWVNRVLVLQRAEVQLVNGRQVNGTKSYRPMF